MITAQIKEPLENQLLNFGEQLSEEIYHCHVMGDLTFSQLKELYRELNLWAKQTERLITLLYQNGMKVKMNYEKNRT
jgi:hypothetical protein